MRSSLPSISCLLSAIILMVIHCCPPCAASLGDTSPLFRQCQNKCVQNHSCPLQQPLSFVWWADEHCFRCRQSCIWNAVDRFKLAGKPVPQFYGKWPFIPFIFRAGTFFLPIQEPASALFSLLNLSTTWTMERRLKRRIPRQWQGRQPWLQFAWAGIFAWLCSFVFHCYDHWLTERLDYGSALGMILSALYATVCFVVPQQLSDLGEKGGHDATKRAMHIPFDKLVGAVLFVFYVHYLHSAYSAAKFDYGFHIQCCAMLSALVVLLYGLWAWTERRKGRVRHSFWLLGAAILLGLLSAAFDAVLDFAPLFWTLDAHSIFHLISIPVPLLWAEFICAEANYAIEESRRFEDTKLRIE